MFTQLDILYQNGISDTYYYKRVLPQNAIFQMQNILYFMQYSNFQIPHPVISDHLSILHKAAFRTNFKHVSFRAFL